ncbi:unnamed protein product [Arctia plantaginis]|uniref:Transporter n=1 Tax=Arctia plantaginis TaxID=874455 RepID=A0A8S1BPE8_ARCPL|nr:unnamed protein product [Arctia plantaginis]
MYAGGSPGPERHNGESESPEMPPSDAPPAPTAPPPDPPTAINAQKTRSVVVSLTPERQRETWGKKAEFLLAVVGFAVDLGNVWRFPYICYQNGGGAFLIPYCIMLLFGGLPLFFMELALGQYHRCGCLTLWKRICPALKGVGYAICMIDIYMGMYYNTIIGWAVYYLVASISSINSVLPWTSCNNEWNTPLCMPVTMLHNNPNASTPAKEFFERNVLEQHRSNGLDDMGPIKPSLALCVFGVFVLVYFSLWKGVRSAGKITKNRLALNRKILEEGNPLYKTLSYCNSNHKSRENKKGFHFLDTPDSKATDTWWCTKEEKEFKKGKLFEIASIIHVFEKSINSMFMGIVFLCSTKVVWVTALAPYLVLLILLARGVTLPGATEGIRYYLTPEWHKLQNSKVWIDAASQIFFSLGPGFGTLLALSSYNKFNNNCYRDALITSSINCLTSFLAGFVIFSVLGYMAHVQQKSIEEVGLEGPGLVFIVYPEAIATMTGSVFWAIIFFLMLITLGLDSTFGGLEAVTTALCDEYPRVLGRHREIFVAVLLLFIYICALPTTTYGGVYLVDLLNVYGPGLAILFVVFAEAAGVCWVYGVDRFSEDVRTMLGHTPGWFWRACWSYISPVFLLVLFIVSVLAHEEMLGGEYQYPPWSITVGWVMTGTTVSCIPLYIIYKFLKTPGSCIVNLYDSQLEAIAKWLSCNGEIWGLGPTAVFASAAVLFLYNELEATVFLPGDQEQVSTLEKTLISSMMLGMLALMIHLWVCSMRFFQYYLDTIIRDSPNMLLEMTTIGLLGGQSEMVPLGPLTRFLRQQQPQIHITVCWFLSLCYADYVRKNYCQRFNMPYLEQWQTELQDRVMRTSHRIMEKVNSFVGSLHQQLRGYGQVDLQIRNQQNPPPPIDTVRVRFQRNRRSSSADPAAEFPGQTSNCVIPARRAANRQRTDTTGSSANRAIRLQTLSQNLEIMSKCQRVHADAIPTVYWETPVVRAPSVQCMRACHILTMNL